MKPTRNHIYCPASNKPKIQFSNEKKAMRFIAYNSDEILEETGVAPVRAYYCHMCCCWHVTSNPDTVHGEIMDSYDKHKLATCDTSRMAQLMQDIKEKGKLAIESFDKNDSDQARRLLKEMRKQLHVMQRISTTVHDAKFTKKFIEATAIYDKVSLRRKDEKALAELTQEQLNYIAGKRNKTERDQRLLNLYDKKCSRESTQILDQCVELIDKRNCEFYNDLYAQRLSEAQDGHNNLSAVLAQLKHLPCSAHRVGRIDKMLARNSRMLAIAQAVHDHDDEALLQLGLTGDEQQRAAVWRSNYEALNRLDTIVSTLHSINDCDQLEATCRQCQHIMDSLQGVNHNHIKHYKEEIFNATTASNEIAKKRQNNVLLLVISKLEQMENDYNAGNITACQQGHSECTSLMLTLRHPDDNTRLIEQYINAWLPRLTPAS